MSTRSMIAMKIGDKYKAIYVHFDGYIAGVGSTLYANYDDPKKIEKLILAGDRSCLSDEVDDKVYKEQYNIECKSIDELIEEFKNLWTEYLYLYEDDKWKVLHKYDEPMEFKDLRTELGFGDSKEEPQQDNENHDEAVVKMAKIMLELYSHENDDLTVKEFREKFCK